MSVNEYVQWAVIVFLAVMVVGLTRQLGRFITPHKQELMNDAPPVGRTLPADLLSPESRAKAEGLIAKSSEGFGVLVVIDHHCLGCGHLVKGLEEEEKALDRLPPLIALLRSDDAEFRERAEAVFDLVDQDIEGERIKEAGIVATPFSMVLGEELRVEHRQIGAGIDDLILNWFEETGKEPPLPEGPRPPVVTRHNAKRGDE